MCGSSGLCWVAAPCSQLRCAPPISSKRGCRPTSDHIAASFVLVTPDDVTHLLQCLSHVPAARHWEYEAARQHRREHLLRLALHSWRAAAEATAGRLAGFWAMWQVEAPLRRALLGWRQAAAAGRADRALEGMAEVHCERRLQRLGLEALASNAASCRAACAPGGAEQQQQQIQQQKQRRQHSSLVPRASHSVGGAQPPRAPAAAWQQPHACVPMQQASEVSQFPSASQQQQQQQPIRTTIVISHSRGTRSDQQEQQAPAYAASGCSCASSSQGGHDAMTDWRAAANFWRQRHASFASALGQPHVLQPAAAPAAVRPATVATLSELRAQWQGRTPY